MLRRRPQHRPRRLQQRRRRLLVVPPSGLLAACSSRPIAPTLLHQHEHATEAQTPVAVSDWRARQQHCHTARRTCSVGLGLERLRVVHSKDTPEKLRICTTSTGSGDCERLCCRCSASPNVHALRTVHVLDGIRCIIRVLKHHEPKAARLFCSSKGVSTSEPKRRRCPATRKPTRTRARVNGDLHLCDVAEGNECSSELGRCHTLLQAAHIQRPFGHFF